MTTQPERLPLPEFICRRVHDYEWSPTSGTHSPMPRRNPCADCEYAASLVEDWLADATGGAELGEAS